MNIVNVFKIHYFLYWGSISGVLNYTILIITEHGGVTQDETGVLYGILPLTLMFAKPLFCSIADKHAIHEWILVTSIIGQTVAYGLLAVLPFIVNKSIIWPMFCGLMLVGSICTGVLTSITDSLVMKVVETEGSSFGQMRVWGTVGWGLISYGVGRLNELDTAILPHYTPGILLFVILQLFDLLLMLCHLKRLREACQKSEYNRERRPTLQETIEQSITQSISQKQHSTPSDHGAHVLNNVNGQSADHSRDTLDTSQARVQLSASEVHKPPPSKQPKKQIMKFVLLTCRYHPHLIKYLFICIIVGLCTALNWNYFTLYLGKLRPDDTNLIGLTAVVQCFASEVPFIYFSGIFIDKIGSNASFSIVLFTFALRYSLYTLFNSQTAYYILFVELTHGITFGLFYYTMNVLAREYSKKMYKVEFDYLMKHVWAKVDYRAYRSKNLSTPLSCPKTMIPHLQPCKAS